MRNDDDDDDDNKLAFIMTRANIRKRSIGRGKVRGRKYLAWGISHECVGKRPRECQIPIPRLWILTPWLTHTQTHK